MERRWSTRKNLYLSIALVVPCYNKRVVPAILLDISPYGAFIETEVLLPTNAALTIDLKVPGHSGKNSFCLNARMMRRTERGVAVAFVGMSVGKINALGEALSQCEQQFDAFKPGFVYRRGERAPLTGI